MTNKKMTNLFPKSVSLRILKNNLTNKVSLDIFLIELSFNEEKLLTDPSTLNSEMMKYIT